MLTCTFASNVWYLYSDYGTERNRMKETKNKDQAGLKLISL